jgi:hypothetical protein
MPHEYLLSDFYILAHIVSHFLSPVLPCRLSGSLAEWVVGLAILADAALAPQNTIAVPFLGNLRVYLITY